MQPSQFRAWRTITGKSQQEAADVLGIPLGTVRVYENGRHDDDSPVNIPPEIDLACGKAFDQQIPWSQMKMVLVAARYNEGGRNSRTFLMWAPSEEHALRVFKKNSDWRAPGGVEPEVRTVREDHHEGAELRDTAMVKIAPLSWATFDS